MWNMYNRMKLPYFGLNVRLLFTDFFGSGFESGFGSGSKTFIPVPDRIRIRPKVSDPSGSGSDSGSGTATLRKSLQPFRENIGVVFIVWNFLIFIFIFGRQLQPFRIQIHCPSWIQTNSDPCLDQKHLMILWTRTAIWLPVRRWRLIVSYHSHVIRAYTITLRTYISLLSVMLLDDLRYITNLWSGNILH